MAPNLNLIELLWKLTKKECLNSKYYDNFSSFSRAIKTFLQTQLQSDHTFYLDFLILFCILKTII